MPTRNDYMARPRCQAKAALLHLKEIETIEAGAGRKRWSSTSSSALRECGMRLVVGVDIGNSTTEACLRRRRATAR